MRYILILLFGLILGCTGTESPFLQTEEVQLADPIAILDSTIFINSANLNIRNSIEDSKIFYSLDRGPFQLWREPLTFDQSTEIDYYTKKRGFENSEMLYSYVIKANNNLRNAIVDIEPQPNSKYPGLGTSSLTDFKTGDINFSSNQNWLGFQDNQVEIKLELEDAIHAETILLSFLHDQNSWIYSPSSITVFVDDDLVGSETSILTGAPNEACKSIIDVTLLNQVYSKLHIIIKSLSEIPSGFPGEGNKPWLFIDEIILN